MGETMQKWFKPIQLFISGYEYTRSIYIDIYHFSPLMNYQTLDWENVLVMITNKFIKC